jgi:Mg2+ and Co2+ transporter CorA
MNVQTHQTHQTQQELIDQNIKMLLGELQLQLVFARSQIAHLETMLNETNARNQESVPARIDDTVVKPNGVGIPN